MEHSLRNRMRQTAVVAALLPSSALHATDVDFNTDILATRGISTNLAHYFSEAQRYLPGKHAVQSASTVLKKAVWRFKLATRASFA